MISSRYRLSARIALFLILVCVLSCGRAEYRELNKEVMSLRSEIANYPSQLQNAAKISSTRYQLFDMDRKIILGYVSSYATISVGQRIFIGGDFWNVEYVKIFTERETPLSMSIPGPPRYSVGYVELIVSYGGKAKYGAKPEDEPFHKTA